MRELTACCWPSERIITGVSDRGLVSGQGRCPTNEWNIPLRNRKSESPHHPIQIHVVTRVGHPAVVANFNPDCGCLKSDAFDRLLFAIWFPHHLPTSFSTSQPSLPNVFQRLLLCRILQSLDYTNNSTLYFRLGGPALYEDAAIWAASLVCLAD